MRLFAIVFLLLVALVSSVIAIFLFKVGHDLGWTSDGPGILAIMIGLLVFVGAAAGSFLGVLSVIGTPAKKTR